MRAVTDLFAGPQSERVAVIAEVGVNHNGDVDLAHRLIDIAVESGAAAVKFQTFQPEALAAASAGTTPYQRDNGGATTQAELLRSLMLPDSAWRELMSHAADLDIRFLSTPFDLASADLLCELGVDVLKMSSGELTNLPFLRAVANLGLPMLVSTGMGDMPAEVEAAVQACAAAPGLALFHCVSAYPAPLEQANLAAIPAMAARLGLPVGWSDHTTGVTSAVIAVTLGARLLEKHFTVSRDMPGPDHRASLEPDELADYVATTMAVPLAVGDGQKRRMPAEEENAPLVRRSWHAARDIDAGHQIATGDVVALRPEAGISASRDVLGRVATRPIRTGEAVVDDMLGQS